MKVRPFAAPSSPPSNCRSSYSNRAKSYTKDRRTTHTIICTRINEGEVRRGNARALRTSLIPSAIPPTSPPLEFQDLSLSFGSPLPRENRLARCHKSTGPPRVGRPRRLSSTVAWCRRGSHQQ